MADTVEVEINGEPVPPSFSVQEYVDYVRMQGYKNDYMNFNFNELLKDFPKAMKTFSNDIVAKAILSHSYGEGMAKHFREWIRGQMDESIQYPCGGATVGIDEEGLND